MTTSTAPKPLPRNWYTPNTPEGRAALAAGYRHLADLIESDDAPIPTGHDVDLFVYPQEDRNAPAVARDLLRALGGGKYEKDNHGTNLILRGMFGGLPINVWIDLGLFCKRVVTGTREVTETVPVGEDTRPVETVTRAEDVVEWHCGSVLDAASEDADTVEVSA